MNDSDIEILRVDLDRLE